MIHPIVKLQLNYRNPVPIDIHSFENAAFHKISLQISPIVDFLIADTEDPVISGIPRTQNASTTGVNSTTAIVSWTPPTATDNSGSVTLIGSHNPGDSFPIGNTTVTYTATDLSGNQATASFNVTVTGKTSFLDS